MSSYTRRHRAFACDLFGEIKLQFDGDERDAETMLRLGVLTGMLIQMGELFAPIDALIAGDITEDEFVKTVDKLLRRHTCRE